MICFKINEFYSSFVAEELLLVIKRTPTKVTFKRESGAEYTVKIDTMIKTDTYTGKKYYIETAVVVPNMVYISAEDEVKGLI